MSAPMPPPFPPESLAQDGSQADASDQPLLALLLRRTRALIDQGHRPVWGLNGPVGAGKSTLAQRCRQHFAAQGLALAVASIDDAYLPWPQRLQRLAGNPFGVRRVPPGSHDPEALAAPLRHWQSSPWPMAGQARAPLQLPRFDKTLRGGDGDRTRDWAGPADAVLLEGWLVGCRPLPEAELLAWAQRRELALAQQDWLLQSNRALEAYAGLWGLLSGLVLLCPTRPELPRRWRFQAEARQRRSGGGWLQPNALNQLVRASLESLPMELHQPRLVAQADWVQLLDGRRRRRWQGSGIAMLSRGVQSSSDCSSATG